MIHGAVSGMCLREVARDVLGPTLKVVDILKRCFIAFKWFIVFYLWGHFQIDYRRRQFRSFYFLQQNFRLWFSLDVSWLLEVKQPTPLAAVAGVVYSVGAFLTPHIYEFTNQLFILYHLSQSRRKSVLASKIIKKSLFYTGPWVKIRISQE